MDWVILASVVGLLAVLTSGRIKPAIAFVSLASAYVLGGIVTPETLQRSFANPGLATLILLMLVSLALEQRL